MSIGAISETSGIGAIPSDRPRAPAPEQAEPAPATALASPIPTGTPQPLSPTVLAALLGQQLVFYGSSHGA
jgi:hypothetical protein